MPFTDASPVFLPGLALDLFGKAAGRPATINVDLPVFWRSEGLRYRFSCFLEEWENTLAIFLIVADPLDLLTDV